MTKKIITKPMPAAYSGNTGKKHIQIHNEKNDHAVSKPVDKQWKEIAEKVLNENIGAWKTLAKE